MPFTEQEQQILHQVARASILQGLQQGQALQVTVADYPASLQAQRASFVTLNRQAALRGCIGTLTAHQPLVADVAYHAHAAAFSDPRFPPLREAELDDLDIHISVLSPAQPMNFSSEADLIAQIRPGIDGLIVRDLGRSGTFLPAVWESLPQVEDFWHHLKRKAGLPAEHWSDSLEVLRYSTESF